MNCAVCGGKLKYTDGIYVCENCGKRQTVSEVFENTEVCICYIESDEQGRRTRDSIIAQDLYLKLEAANINTFYQRISASDLTEFELEKACMEAKRQAQVLLVLGTTREYFERITENVQDYFGDKKVIPVCSGIDASHLPDGLSNLQAVNYDSIGSLSVLIKNILYILGREKGNDVIEAAGEKRKKRKHTAVLCICIALIIVLAAGTYIVFGTPYILKSKKYDYAAKLAENKDYVKAISIYTDLGDYRDSEGLLKSIYDKYDGYYVNEVGDFTVYLNTVDNLKAEVQVTKTDKDNKTVSFTESFVLNNGETMFHFSDTQGNQGSATIEFLNDGIKLVTEAESSEAELSIGNQSVTFSMSNKTDKPIADSIDASTLLSWLNKETYDTDITQMGYEMETVSNIGMSAGTTLYQIKNTDIQILIKNPRDAVKGIADEEDLESFSDKNIIKAIIAPAGIVASDKIGTNISQYSEGNILYLPNGVLNGNHYGAYLSVSDSDDEIEANTPVILSVEGEIVVE